ncbi:MAG: hypothetical protein JNJ71_20570 [Rubrivivax sp.]|nr:hypothetical protein [Rubrivivax sp.]
MTVLTTLVRREWMQHRFGWALLALLPTALAVLLLSFGQIELGGLPSELSQKVAVIGFASLAVPTAAQLGIFWLTSLIIVTGLARRDHADRSVEFWLSMPIGHSQSLAVPLLVHLILAPLAALAIGVAAGLLISLVVVTRISGFDTWLGLPWSGLMATVAALAARLALGVFLATLWLSPIILAVVLMTAWFRRWGLVILGVGVGLGSGLIDRLLGVPWPWELLRGLVERAARGFIHASDPDQPEGRSESLSTALEQAPHWLAGDAMLALRELASPWLLGTLLVSALLFAGLVHWRRLGASAGS